MKNFQLVTIIVFIVFAVGGVILFATFRDTSDFSSVKIVIWGQESDSSFNKFLGEFDKNTDRKFDVAYTQVKGENFADEVVEAIASGGGPDLILLSSKELLRFEDKLLPISYEVVSERGFKDAFLEGGEVFLKSSGILALPISVDPLVMYWNRDILQSNGIASPPKFWSELFSFSERITDKDEALNITRSAVALGEYRNIKNAKEILFSLFVQSGTPVITRRATDDRLRIVLNERSGQDVAPAESAVRFYTEFSNPTKISYSWNRALDNSQDEFVAGDLALYFGLASELPDIRKKNPNLNFDVALLPQISDSDNKKVAGELKAFAILKRSKNINVALSVATSLVSEENVRTYSELSGLPPVRRSLLSESPEFAFENLFYQSALVTEAFLDPGAEKTDSIFQGLIERVVSGRERISSALSRATTELNALIVDN